MCFFFCFSVNKMSDEYEIQLDVDEFCAAEDKAVERAMNITYDDISDVSIESDVDIYIVEGLSDSVDKDLSLDTVSDDDLPENKERTVTFSKENWQQDDLCVSIERTVTFSKENMEHEVSFKVSDQLSSYSDCEIGETRTVTYVDDFSNNDNPIFINSDFVLDKSGDTFTKDEIENLVIKRECDVIDEVKKIRNLKRDIWVSFCGKNSLINPLSLPTYPQKSVWNQLKRKKVLEVTSVIDELNKLIGNAGGTLFIVGLLPCPALIDPENSVYSKGLQELNSQVFIKINKEIDRLNLLYNNTKTVHLNNYVEVKRPRSSGKSSQSRRTNIIEHRTSDYYPGRDQRKVKLDFYEGDRETLKPSVLKEIAKTIAKAISSERKKKEKK